MALATIWAAKSGRNWNLCRGGRPRGATMAVFVGKLDRCYHQFRRAFHLFCNNLSVSPDGPLAQLDKASAYGAEDCAFESRVDLPFFCPGRVFCIKNDANGRGMRFVCAVDVNFRLTTRSYCFHFLVGMSTRPGGGSRTASGSWMAWRKRTAPASSTLAMCSGRVPVLRKSAESAVRSGGAVREL